MVTDSIVEGSGARSADDPGRPGAAGENMGPEVRYPPVCRHLMAADPHGTRKVPLHACDMVLEKRQRNLTFVDIYAVRDAVGLRLA